MGEDPLDGACCGSCAHAKRVAEGKVVHPPSPALRISLDGPEVLLVGRGGTEIVRIPLRRNQRLKVGRSRDLCDVALADAALSRVTCLIEVTDAGEVFVEDLKSSCGTLVNGVKVIRSGLHQKDEIHVGSSVFTFESS